MARLGDFLLLICLFTTSAVSLADRKSTYYEDILENDVERTLGLLQPKNLFKNQVSAYKDIEPLETLAIDYTCRLDVKRLMNATALREDWALKMLDAASKIPAGILQGNVVDLGMYDECIGVHYTTSKYNIRGQHCMYSMNFTQLANKISNFLMPSLSICVPHSCKEDDIMKMINRTINNIDWKNITVVSVDSVKCVNLDTNIWDTKFVVCFWILDAFICLLVICSVCDAYYVRLEPERQKNSSSLRFLGQFSLQRNAAAILSTKVKKGNMPAIHGIRFLSMAWVVLGHEYMMQASGINVNGLSALDWFLSWDALYILIAPFSVDTFFALSGFLMAYVFLKQMPKEKFFNLPMYYVHRYFRLTPPVIALIVLTMVFLPKMGSGPRWETGMTFVSNNCEQKWWQILLYLQNFIDRDQDQQCLTHLWYLAVDMQLFFISPIILYPLYKKPKVGLIILTSLILASLVTPAVIVAVNNYRVFSFTQIESREDLAEGFKNVYSMPHTRAGPWLIGILLGYEVLKDRRLNKSTAYLGWIMAMGCFAFCTFGSRYFMRETYEYNNIQEALFAAFARPIWGVGVCWIIYTSIRGYGGPISWLLSFKIYQPLSRLSYCVYLVHMVVESIDTSRIRTSGFFSEYDVWTKFFSVLMLSFIAAFIFSLLFESPILILEKTLLKKKKQESHTESRTNLTENGATNSAQDISYKKNEFTNHL